MTNSNITPNYQDEMDLAELIAKLWHEKIIIITTTIIAVILGIIYTFISVPLYHASAQLSPPSVTELTYLNQTKYFSINPTRIFSDFFEVLVSDNHISQLAMKNSEILENALDIKADEDAINNILGLRNVKYPHTNNKSSIQPDNYYLSYKGTNRHELRKLITQDIKQAKIQVLSKVHERYKTILNQKITLLSRVQQLDLKKLDDKLTSRKAYVISSRKDRLRRLEEALKIAKVLNIQSPTSIAKLSTSNQHKQVEINAELNNNQDPLYLRGIKLLTAEIDNLKALENNIFLDNQIRKLEADKIIIGNNRELEQLKSILESFEDKADVHFHSGIINTPSKPVSPNKKRVIAVSILAGCILGFFIAIGRQVYQSYNRRKLQV